MNQKRKGETKQQQKKMFVTNKANKNTNNNDYDDNVTYE
jgi:hypothetical protein